MKFDRYKILIEHYTNQISSWDWPKIKDNAYTNCRANDSNDSVYGQSWLGTALGMYPSGKIYAFWTSNQTKADITKDECFIEALNKVAQDHEMHIDYSDDGDLLACVTVDEAAQVKRYITERDQELGEEIFNFD